MDDIIQCLQKKELISSKNNRIHNTLTIIFKDPVTDSLRSQYYAKFRSLVNQSLEALIRQIKGMVCNKQDSDNLVSTLLKLKSALDTKLQLTAEEQHQKDQILHKMFIENENTEQKLFALRKDIEDGQRRFHSLLNNRLELIESHRNEISQINEKTGSYLNTQIFRSEQNMQLICKENAEAKKQILQDLNAAEEQLKIALEENLQNEQSIRKEKLSAQIQLKKWLNKYDSEVGGRTKTLRELQKIFGNEQSFLEKLEETCANQEVQYVQLMLQKDTEEKQLQEEKMLVFMMNRSARIIQRYWRLVLAKRRLKKGKRKGRGKKSS